MSHKALFNAAIVLTFETLEARLFRDSFLGEIDEQSCHGAARIAESRELGTHGTKSGGLVMSPPDPLSASL